MHQSVDNVERGIVIVNKVGRWWKISLTIMLDVHDGFVGAMLDMQLLSTAAELEADSSQNVMDRLQQGQTM